MFGAVLKGVALNVLYMIPPVRRGLTAGEYNPDDTVEEMMERVREKASWLTDRVPGGVTGRTVVEVGPGGDFALEIALMGLGAARTIAIDRDASLMPARSARIRALHERVAAEFGVPLSSLGGPHDGLRPAFCQYLVGKGIEREDRVPAGSVDVISSFAVLEHLFRLDRAFAAMRRLLKPGGWMIHKVDLRDHTDFDRPLDFLRYPQWLWLLSRWKWSYMNRMRWSAYPPILGRNGFHLADWWPTHTLSHEELAAQRPRLARRFRNLNDHDLKTVGVGFLAQRVR